MSAFGLSKAMYKLEEWLNSTFSLIPKENSNSLQGNSAVFLGWCRWGFAAAHHVRSNGYLQAKDCWHVLVLSFLPFPITNHQERVTNFPMQNAKGMDWRNLSGSVFKYCHQADGHSRRLQLIVRTLFWKWTDIWRIKQYFCSKLHVIKTVLV